MQKVAKNSFEGALNTYTDEQKLEPRYYTEAHNIVLTDTRKFYSPTNIKGTQFLKNLVGGTGGVDIATLTDANIKAVPATFNIGTETGVKCIVYFIAGTDGSRGLFYILCMRLDNYNLYYLYNGVITSTGYFTADRVVDARLYPENGVDYIYFTDFYNELRQLRCEIPTGASDYFLTDYDLSLQRRGANGTVILTSINSGGGSLLSGSYQYAYRMVDPTNKRYTKWSSLCQPIHVYNANNSTAPVYSSIGLPTAFSITVTITPSPEEAAHFDYYQLAVVENIYGVTTAVQPASLLPVQTFTGSSVTYTQKSNEKIGTVPISDLVVDFAAINAVKSLAIKQNRLFAGNVKYHSLEFDNGTPSATGSISVSVSSENDAYSDHVISSTKRTYFRDEVYRFGIVYKDKYGNRSPVQVLNLHGIANNTISGSIPDVRFPARTTNTYSLFNNTTHPKLLYLALSVTNHPTWAVGFEIVRAKRKKRILFQTPVIPMTSVEGIGAFENYPSKANFTSSATDYPDAQPQKMNKVYTPKNLFWPEIRQILRRATDNGAAGADFANVGEARLFLTAPGDQPNYSVIFPPQTIYQTDPYTFVGSEKVETIDYAIAKSWVTAFETSPPNEDGNHVSTQVSGVWYALDQGDYYFDSAQVGKSVFESPTHIKDSQYFENVSPGGVMGGNRIMTYSDLSGTGVDWGFEQQPQRSVVIETANMLPDVIVNTSALLAPHPTGALTFANATLNVYASGAYITGASGPQYEQASGISNKYIHQYTNYVDHTSYTQAFRIANITNDLGDDRYGSVDTQHEFISTGASYTFNNTELANVQAKVPVFASINVYGGDCFIAAHTFKLNDTWYSVTNQGKNNTPATHEIDTDLVKYWGRHYTNIGVTNSLCIPVALEGASQFVQVILENEYNGGVMGEDIIWAVTTVNDFPAMNLNDDFNTPGSLRSPLLYKYNNNISKQNDQKVYFPLPTINNIQNNFKSRIAYSDLKIYDSDVQGFDVFRVGNIYDLEESRGAITKLAIASDDVYAIQESGMVWVPTAQNQIQQTDAGALAVGTGDVIGRPVVVHQTRGSIHSRGIVETGDTIFVPDARNRTVYKLAGRQFTTIDASSVIFGSPTSESSVVGFYDPLHHCYFLSDKEAGTVYSFNELIGEGGSWIGNYEFNQNSAVMADGVWTNDKMHLTSLLYNTTVTTRLWVLYEGDYNLLFNNTVVPRIKFTINQESDISKTFDDMMLSSDQRLDQAVFTVEHEDSLGDQTCTVPLDSLEVEGGYRIKILRDAANARLRGQRMTAEIKWKTGISDKATLSSVLTKYRPSARTPF